MQRKLYYVIFTRIKVFLIIAVQIVYVCDCISLHIEHETDLSYLYTKADLQIPSKLLKLNSIINKPMQTFYVQINMMLNYWQITCCNNPINIILTFVLWWNYIVLYLPVTLWTKVNLFSQLHVSWSSSKW